MKFYMKLFDKHHELIDELHLVHNIEYTKTLNGINSMTFNVPINYLADKNVELCLGQHIELYMIKNNKENLLWYGVINNPCPKGIDLQVTCLGYASLLQNRKFIDIELNQDNEWKRSYYSKTYGKLIFELINQINSISETGIITGINKDTSLTTDRILNWNDDLYDKIQEFLEDSNCYFEIDNDRKFNFYKEVGEDKSEYFKITDSNIIGDWDYTIDYTQLANNVISRSTWEEKDGENNVKHFMYGQAIDEESINLYGQKDYILDVGDTRLQESVNTKCNEYLKTYSKPLISCTVEVGITEEFDIFQIEAGDYINLNTSKYNINEKIRLLEYKVNLSKLTATTTLGNAIFRESTFTIYRY